MTPADAGSSPSGTVLDRCPCPRVVVVVGAIVLCATALVDCGGADGPSAVSLSALVANQDRYDGTRVEVRGHVRAFGESDGARYFVLEDARHNRVEIQPTDVASQYRGSVVHVTGCFTANSITGRTLRLSSIVRDTRGTPRRSRIPTHRACAPTGGPVA